MEVGAVCICGVPFSLQLCNWSVVQKRRSEKGPYVLLCPALLCKDGISRGSCQIDDYNSEQNQVSSFLANHADAHAHRYVLYLGITGLHLGFCSRGGKIVVSAYQGGGGKRYMLYITIYI